MQIQGMTLEELKNRVEIGMVELDKQDVWQLLEFATEMENELSDFEELKEEKASQDNQLDNALLTIEEADKTITKLEIKNDDLKDIIEQALDMVKNPDLYEECIDQLIDTLKGGLK